MPHSLFFARSRPATPLSSTTALKRMAAPAPTGWFMSTLPRLRAFVP